MKTIFHDSQHRGFANHGWLQSYHSFSFAQYYDSNKMHFGALRVLNDDTVSGGMGFSKHPHQNMEIISLPLEGALKHGDNMGNSGIIQSGDIQVMSAGKGIVHSEQNANLHQEVKFLQIWIYPNRENVEPRYDQYHYASENIKNNFQVLLSPNLQNQGIWIHQEAWLYRAEFDAEHKQSYTLKSNKNGVYIFVLKGKIKIENQILQSRDALGVWETQNFSIEAIDNSEFIIIEIPMDIPNLANQEN